MTRREIGGYGEPKVYEMLWCFVGIAKLYQATGRPILLQAIVNHWEEVRKHHLNAAGGPCGGVGVHPEVYNVRYMFSHLFPERNLLDDGLDPVLGRGAENHRPGQICRANRALGLQRDPRRAVSRRTAMDLPQQYERRARADRRVCLLLRQRPDRAGGTPRDHLFVALPDGIAVNLYAASKASLRWGGETVAIEQITNYPHDGKVVIRIGSDHKLAVPILLRIPSWIGSAPVKLNGKSVQLQADQYYAIAAQWKAGDTIEIEFPMPVRTVEQRLEYNEKGWFMDAQCAAYLAVYRGPLLYATEWKDLLDAPNPIGDSRQPEPFRAGTGSAPARRPRSGADPRAWRAFAHVRPVLRGQWPNPTPCPRRLAETEKA